MPKPRTSPLDRILSNCVETASGCWEFRGYVRPNGYGSVGSSDGTRRFYVHRVTYAFFIHEIPEGLVIDHLCRNRACCNPWHLEPVTQMVNVHRGEGHSSETHCPAGHPYSQENTYVDSRRKRECRTCWRVKAARRQLKANVCRVGVPAS